MKSHIKTLFFCVVAIIAAAIFGSANLGNAMGSSGEIISLPKVDHGIVLRQQRFEFDRLQLLDPDRTMITLRLFDNISIKIILMELSRDYAGTKIRHGSIVGSSRGYATFAVGKSSISGNILTDSGFYHLRTIADNVLMVQEINPSIHAARRQKSAAPKAQEDDVIVLTNEERAKYSLPPLGHHYLLTDSAQGHSDDMATNNYFSHEGLDGSNASDRITAAGYIWNAIGENIAAGQISAEEVVLAWINSPGHHANMLNENFCEIGVGYSYNTESDYIHYWVQNFGRQLGVSTCPEVVNPPTPDPTDETTGSGNTSIITGWLGLLL